MSNNKVWFVTGASKGLGLSLVKKLLKEGYRVAATSRNLSDLSKAVDNHSDQFLPLAVNIKNEESVQEVPLFSLYSETRSPTPEQLAIIDTLIIDLPDVGCRYEINSKKETHHTSTGYTPI